MELDVEVFAASLDDVATQAAFAKAQSANFSFLSDPDGSAAGKYEVLLPRGFAKRVTFVVDPEGILRHIDQAVDVDQHGQDLVALVKRLQAQ